jgi:hypothetical protein
LDYGTAYVASGIPLTDGECAFKQIYTLSQHPPLPQSTDLPSQEGVYGVVVAFGHGQEDPNNFFEQQFPAEIPFQQCTPLPVVRASGKPAGPTFVTAVQYLTVTSTTQTTGSSQISKSHSMTQASTTTTAHPNVPTRGNHLSTTSVPNRPAIVASSSAQIVVGTNTLIAITSSSVAQFVVSSQTLPLGGTITIGSGNSQTTIALTTDNVGNTVLNVGGQPSTVSNLPSTVAPITVGSATLSPVAPSPPIASSPVLVVFDQTLSVGGSVTVGTGPSQTIVALSTNQAGNTVLNVGGQVSTLGTSVNAGGPFVAGDITLTPTSTSTAAQFVVAQQTLTVGGSITLGSGVSQTLVALTTNAAGATVLNAGGQLSTLSDQQASVAPLVVAGTTLAPIAGSSGAFSVAGTTLSVGGSVTIGVGSASTTILALSTDNAGHTVLVSNGQSSTLAPATTAAPNLILFGTSITANSPASASQGFVISGQTLSVGGTVTLGSGTSATTLALQTDVAGHTIVVLNGVSSTISAATAGVAPIIVGGQTITAASLPGDDGGFVVAGQTLTVGGSVTLGSGPSATTIALQTDYEGHTFIVSNGVSSQIAAPTTGLAPLTIDGQTISATTLSSGNVGFIIDGQTLAVGGAIEVGSGSSLTTLALVTDSSGHTLIVSNGHTSEIPTITTPSIVINGQTIEATALPSGSVGFIVSGQTLTEGGSITASGTVFTLTTDAAGYTILASHGHTSVLPNQISAGPRTIDGQTISQTMLPSGIGEAYLIDGQTLTPGGSVTISGTTYTLTTDPEGNTVLIDNGKTSAVPTAGVSMISNGMVSVTSKASAGPVATATSATKKSNGSKGVDGWDTFGISFFIFSVVGVLFSGFV